MINGGEGTESWEAREKMRELGDGEEERIREIEEKKVELGKAKGVERTGKVEKKKNELWKKGEKERY